MKKLNILHLSTNDFGGAGKAAVRIHTALLDDNIQSTLLVKHQSTNTRRVFSSKTKKWIKVIGRIFEVAQRRLRYKEKYLMYSAGNTNVSSLMAQISQLDIKPNIIMLHWVANFVTLKDIYILKESFECEIFWYAMDMSPFTGGCHFSWGCKLYNEDCLGCPAERNFFKVDAPFKYFSEKMKCISDCSVRAIAPNKWVAKQIENSGIEFKSIDVCYLPIDERVFTPIVKKNATNRPIKLLFGYSNLNDLRKGANYFVNAMKELNILMAKTDYQSPIVILPSDSVSELEVQVPFNVERINYATTEKELSEIYQLSDVFICTSIEDSGPMMVCESLMSGIPVIGFEMGVSPELIVNGYNGYIVELKNSTSLAESIFKFIKKNENEQSVIRDNARASVESIMSSKAHLNSLLRIITQSDNQSTKL
jgi:glycosyltransferase involved in cell wall biosynthesis